VVKDHDLGAELAEITKLLGESRDYRFSTLPSLADEKMMDLCEHFMQADEDRRAAFLSSLEESTAYALLAFAERMSMLSVRRGSERLLLLGLVGLVLAAHRIDPRMGLMVLSLLHRSAEKMGLDPGPVFRAAAGYARAASVSDLVVGFLGRDPKHKDIRAMGFQEIEGPSGLIYWQGGPKPIPEGLK
jgi:hypothetical protein